MGYRLGVEQESGHPSHLECRTSSCTQYLPNTPSTNATRASNHHESRQTLPEGGRHQTGYRLSSIPFRNYRVVTSQLLHNRHCDRMGYNAKLLSPFERRDVRVVEGARLESVCTGNRTKGSNPFLSAIHFGSIPDTWVTVHSGDMGNTHSGRLPRPFPKIFTAGNTSVGDRSRHFVNTSERRD